jgi:hypothetical protein
LRKDDVTPAVQEFVTPRVHGDFNRYPIGTRGDLATKLLWTIDDAGAHFVPEGLQWNSSRGYPSHTNMSYSAYAGGDAWRTGPNELTINAGSSSFGYNAMYAETLSGQALETYRAEMQARFDRAAGYLRLLGFEVRVIPIIER